MPRRTLMSSSHLQGPDGPFKLRPRRLGIPHMGIVTQKVGEKLCRKEGGQGGAPLGMPPPSGRLLFQKEEQAGEGVILKPPENRNGSPDTTDFSTEPFLSFICHDPDNPATEIVNMPPAGILAAIVT